MKKTCTVCGEEKQTEDFGINRAYSSGYDSNCRICRYKKVKAYRQSPQGKAKYRSTQKKYMSTDKYKSSRRKYEKSDLGRKKRVEHAKTHKEKYPEKIRAREKTLRAINTGVLKRMPCEKCGASNVEAHHEDYSKPLDITWLCKAHHQEIHHVGSL